MLSVYGYEIPLPVDVYKRQAVLAAILLGMSAFASGSEIAFFSLSPTDVAELEDEKTEDVYKRQLP